jgi:hypothetical protein
MDDAMKTMVRNLEEKTGRTLQSWIADVRKSGETKHGQIVKKLKENGLTHGYANLVAHQALESDASFSEGDDLVASHYAGAKQPLRPVYDAIVEAIRKFGPDVDLSPKKTYVSVRRKKQFAILQPSTATRFDVGINLKGTPPTDRLEPSGSFNAMVTHRVRLATAKDVDKELIAWLKKAYEAAT